MTIQWLGGNDPIIGPGGNDPRLAGDFAGQEVTIISYTHAKKDVMLILIALKTTFFLKYI